MVKKVRFPIPKPEKRQVVYYYMHRRDLEIKADDFVLLERHWLSFRGQKRVTIFGPNVVGTFTMLDVVNSNLVIDVDVELTTVNLQGGAKVPHHWSF